MYIEDHDLRAFTRQVHLHGTLLTTSALRVGSARNTDLEGEDLPVVKDALQRPLIPGSSIKGAMRSQAERMLRTLGSLAPEAHLLSCDPLSNPCLSNEQIQNMKRRPQADRNLYENTCWACRLFGSPWLASHVFFKDALVDENSWFDNYQHRDGVSIDRDKKTAAYQRLYSFEAVPANTLFNFEIVLLDATDADVGLLLLTLIGLSRQHFKLGGARSRGLGNVIAKIDWEHVVHITPENALLVLGASARGKTLPTESWSQQQRNDYVDSLFSALPLSDELRNSWQEARSPGGIT